ncbi:MAG: hypothetical protein NTV33_00545, partial [Coprothermobacterota bacterium]|nr:hypothetical protein [Coprothermobacterota bacterium]
EGEGIIKAFIDFLRGRLFCCPLCGKPVKACDTTEKEWRQHDSPRQGVLENKASLCQDSPCAGGFETRPYEDHSGVHHIEVDKTSRVKEHDHPWDRP